MSGVKSLRVKLHTRVAIDALRNKYSDFTLVEALHTLADTKHIVELLDEFADYELLDELLDAKYFADRYNAYSEITSRQKELLTREVAQKATRNVEVILKLYKMHYDDFDEFVERVVNAYYNARGGDAE